MSYSYRAWYVARKRSNRERHCERIDRAQWRAGLRRSKTGKSLTSSELRDSSLREAGPTLG